MTGVIDRFEDMRLDSHKMIYHPKEVTKWLNGEPVYPINVEIGLSGACNHRCIFCAFEYLKYKPVFLEKMNLLKNISIMRDNGLKSVLYAGFGEPLLNREAADVIAETKGLGVDVALSTNGVFFDIAKQDKCLSSLSWIRFSFAAPSDRNYAKIHKCDIGDYKKVIKNIEIATKKRNKENLSVTLGVQMLILSDSVQEIPIMAKLCKELGVDYVSIKPFNQGHKILQDQDVPSDVLTEAYDRAKEYEDDKFRVIIRKNLIKQHLYERPIYNKCGMLDFFCIINADGSVIPCTVFPGNTDFVYGNINYDSLDKIWLSKRRKEVVQRINNNEFEKYCLSEDCKMRMQNEYLFKLKNPHPHVNFI